MRKKRYPCYNSHKDNGRKKAYCSAPKGNIIINYTVAPLNLRGRKAIKMHFIINFLEQHAQVSGFVLWKTCCVNFYYCSMVDEIIYFIRVNVTLLAIQGLNA